MVLPLRGAHKQGIWRVRTPRVATAATAKGFEWWTTWQKQEEQSKSQNLVKLALSGSSSRLSWFPNHFSFSYWNSQHELILVTSKRIDQIWILDPLLLLNSFGILNELICRGRSLVVICLMSHATSKVGRRLILSVSGAVKGVVKSLVICWRPVFSTCCPCCHIGQSSKR